MADRQFINPTRKLSDKVRQGGPSPHEAVLRALNAAEDLVGQYQGWAVDDLEKLWQAFQETSTEGRADPKRLEELYDLAHETRGQGGSFNFPLISIIGDSLCKYLEGKVRLRAADLEIIRVHILAMKATFRQELKGKQEGLSRELSVLLQVLRDKTDSK